MVCKKKNVELKKKKNSRLKGFKYKWVVLCIEVYKSIKINQINTNFNYLILSPSFFLKTKYFLSATHNTSYCFNR
jgi:hypothetical protein